MEQPRAWAAMRHRAIASVDVLGVGPSLAGRFPAPGLCDDNSERLASTIGTFGLSEVFSGCFFRDKSAFSPHQLNQTAKNLKLYGERADKGDTGAQYNLGLIYEPGGGGPQDDAQAYMRVSIRAVHGDHEALAYRDEIDKQMTLARNAEGKKLALEWKPVGAGVTTPPNATTTPMTGVSPPISPPSPGLPFSHSRIGPV